MQVDKTDEELWREQCRRQMARPLALRERYGFVSVYRPVMDDVPYRIFHTMADYRKWCDENLPAYLGYKILAN
ncbi:MAG: hypothetical protein ABIZ56_05890 [Chthoniobacteraceae bacterium]